MKRDINLTKLVEKQNVFNTLEQEYETYIDPNISVITGNQAIAYKIAKEMQTEPGSNYYDPDFGSPLYFLFKAITPRDESRVRQEFPILLRFLAEKIKNEQFQDETLQESEKLVDLNLISLELNVEQGI